MKQENSFRSSGYRELVDGLTGYDILRMPGCPITLPMATSMTQAALDMASAEPRLKAWYLKQKESPKHEKKISIL